MISTLVSLKIRIVRNSLHGGRFRKIATLVSYIGSATLAVFGAHRVVSRAHAGGQLATESIVITLTMMFGLWVFGPLLVGGVDDSLDPSRLTMLPINKRDMHRGMFAGAMIGPLPIATVITLIGTVVAYGGGIGTIGVIAAAIVMLFLTLGAARSMSVALAFATRTRRGKDVAMLLASLGAALIFLVTQSLRFLRTEDKVRIIRILRWLPAGQIATAMQEFKTGHLGTASVRTVGIGLLAAVLLHAWVSGIDRLLIDADSVRHTRKVKDRNGLLLVHGWLQRWIEIPVAVMVAKELRYLVRSPQRRSSMIVSVVIGTVFALLQSFRYNSANTLSVFGAPIAMLFGVHATNNLLGTDAASLWMEQSTGTRLKEQLVARGIAATPNLFIPTILASFVLAVMTNGYLEFCLVAIVAVTCIGIPLGVGSVISVVAPFTQPDSSNPHSNRRVGTGQGGLVSILAFVGITLLMGLFIPVAIIVGVGYKARSYPMMGAGLVISSLYSLWIWRIGLRWALRITSEKEVDLLSRIGGRRAAT
jgi:ABC-2 type transport system permease protein